ncbi:class I SAM-dependent methyltransferase [Limnohabitans sp.]|jgi:SAM-dependent methyltransferase
MSEANYYGNVNPTLLQVVDQSAMRICEFGCGAGALARAIKTRLAHPVHYVGIEIAAEELAKANGVLDVGLVRNLDQIKDWQYDSEMAQALPAGDFDHVIFGDVLEHLYEPELVLQQAVSCLKPQGSALVCIPNVQHWSVWLHLLRGSWPRQSSGIFDRTHIRWFALADMVALLQGQGLVVEKVIPRIFDAEKGQALIDALMPAAQLAGVSPERFKQLSQPLQYVLVARKLK